MYIIPYEERYRDEVRQICIDTGSPDNKINPEHYQFTLLMYCDPYLDNGTAFLLMDDEKVCGYILCAEDIDQFEKDFEPYKERINKECPHFRQRTDLSTYEKYSHEYPAHLHIDIEEGHTGKGSGTLLMKTLIDYLEKKHIPGLMVGVDRHNIRAYSFYQKMGFQVLEEDESSAVLGRKI